MTEGWADITIQFTDDGRYADAGFTAAAIEQAKAAGTLRKFRVKYAGQCAGCGKRLQTGQPVVSPSKGKLVGPCCNPRGWNA